MTSLTVNKIGPSATLQDLGRPGFTAYGLSAGGAVDREAIIEGAVLLGQPHTLPALEMAGWGGEFVADADIRIALTGAPMSANVDGEPLLWNASHFISAGQKLTLGGTFEGIYSYLHVGGGFQGELILSSCSAHLAAGIGAIISQGDVFEVGEDTHIDDVGQGIRTDKNRFTGGEISILPSTHTELFSDETKARFEESIFHRTPKGNRQGAELTFEGAPFASSTQLNVISEAMVPGDIQMTGEGEPFVLLPECQTVGGYPRIGAVIPSDFSRVGQSTTKVPLRFKFVRWEEAQAAYKSADDLRAQARSRLYPLIRDPARIRDLLKYQLISGAIAGDEEEL